MTCLAQNFGLLARQPRGESVMLWVDTNRWNPALQSEFANAGLHLVLFESTQAAVEWLEHNPALKHQADKLCLVTNQNRPEGSKAGNNLVDRMRDLGWGDIPAMVYCGQANWIHNRRYRLDIMCGVTDDSLRDFVLAGKPGIPLPVTGAMSGAPVPTFYVPFPLTVPPPPHSTNTLRFVVMSNTHSVNPNRIPFCDYVLHAGGFTVNGTKDELTRFAEWVQQAQLRVRYGIIVVAGESEKDNMALAKEIVGAHCCFLDDQLITLAGGIRLYGASWHGGAVGGEESLYVPFQQQHQQQQQQQAGYHAPDAEGGVFVGGATQSQQEINILLTHQPPTGYFDVSFKGENLGSQLLRKIVDSRKPLVHVFGYNHEGYGAFRNDSTVFVAAALCQGMANDDRLPRRTPLLLDIPVFLNRGFRPALVQRKSGEPKEIDLVERMVL